MVVEVRGGKEVRKMGGWMEVGKWMGMVLAGLVFVVAGAGVVAGATRWRGWKEWMMEVGKGLLTPTIAGVTLLVLVGQAGTGARQTEIMEEQARAAGMEWRLGAWEKRYEVYEQTMKLMVEASREGWVGEDRYLEWYNRALARTLLFGNEVRRVMREIGHNCYRMGELERTIVNPGSREELGSLQKWFGEEKDRVAAVFWEYLLVEEK